MGDNYWDFISEKGRDNVWKRVEIVKRLLDIDLIDKRVLEIGVGLGTAAGAVHATIIGCWKYSGTDVSQANCDLVKKMFNLNVVKADISKLPFPDKNFDVVIALDVLEHVENKETGFAEINRVLKDYGTIVLNIPLSESRHDEDQEFGFDKHDLFRLLDVCGMELEKYETYSAKPFGKFLIHYAWAVGVR